MRIWKLRIRKNSKHEGAIDKDDKPSTVTVPNNVGIRAVWITIYATHN